MLFFDVVILVLYLIGIFYFKSLILKIVLFVLWYPLFVLALFKYGIPMSGILAINMDTFSPEIVNYAFYSYVIGFLLFEWTLFPCRNEVYTVQSIKCDNGTKVILFMLLCLSCIPILNIHEENAVFKSATFYLVFASLLLLVRCGYLLKLGMLSVAFFLIINGERVDSIFIIILIYVLRGNSIKKEKYDLLFLFCAGTLFFILLIVVGFTRVDGDFNLELILSAIYSQRTVTDVVYVYLTGVSYVFENSYYPEVLYNLFGGLLPGETSGVTSIYQYSNKLRDYMYNPGGGMFFTEGMLLMGGGGVALYLLIYGIIIRYLFGKQKGISRVLFILILVMQCRIVWYGMIFCYKPALLLVIAYFLIKKVSSSIIYSNEYSHSK